jgi:hypothetical protein
MQKLMLLKIKLIYWLYMVVCVLPRCVWKGECDRVYISSLNLSTFHVFKILRTFECAT